MVQAMLWSSLPTILKLSRDTWWPIMLWWSWMGGGTFMCFWSSLQKFCLIPQYILYCSPPCHTWTCRSLHSFAGWYLYLWGVPGGPWWCCLLWKKHFYPVFSADVFAALTHAFYICDNYIYGLFLLPDLFVFLVVPWLLLLFFFCLMLALVRAHSGYLHLLRALLRWSSFSFSRWLLEQTVLAVCFKVLITLNVADRWWWLFQYKHRSVCVGFLCSDVSRELSGCDITIVSRKGMDPSVLASSCKLDVWVYTIDVLQETVHHCSIYDYKSVIHIPLPNSWRVLSCVDGLDLKILM